MPEDIKKTIITDEIATARKDIDLFTGWLGRLENPDPVLMTQGAGKGLKLYDEVARDAHASAVLQTRYLAVVGREWEIIPCDDTPAEEEKADFLKEMFESLNITQAFGELLKGILYGFWASEVMWAAQNGQMLPARLIGKHPRRFVFTPERELRLLTPQNMVTGEELPDRKFIVYTHGDSDNPYGQGLGQILWWPVWFKKNGIKFWLVFLEKFGMPTTVGKYPPGTDKAQQQALLDAIDAIHSETGIKIPDTMAIELLEASRTGNVTYEKLCDYMDRQISKAVLGQTLTTEVKGEGSYAASQTHDEVRQDIIKADADMLCECLNNTLVKWAIDLNFGPQTDYPQFWIRVEEEKDLLPQAQRDRILVGELGVKTADKYFRDTYGLPEPEGDDEGIAGLITQRPTERGAPGAGDNLSDRSDRSDQTDRTDKKPKQFAEPQAFTPEQQIIEDLVDRVLPDAAAIRADMTAKISRLIDQAESWEDVLVLLAESLGDKADGLDMEDLLARTLTAANMWGRYARTDA